MPIERRSSSAQVRSILIAVVTIVFIATLGYAVFRAATGERAPSVGGDAGGRWNTGSAETKADAIAEDGPILIPDPAGSQRLPIYLSHVGDSPERGWYAFEARPPGGAAGCFLEWDADDELFRSGQGCTDDETYPVDGDGLRQFATSVSDDGDLIVDLTPKGETTTTTTAG